MKKGSIYSHHLTRFTCLLFFVLAMVIGPKTYGQIKYPFTISISVNQPTVFLADYYSPGSNKLRVNFIFNDLNEPSWDVKFRLRIEGQNIRLETKPSYNPAPFSATSGVTLAVNGEDLAGYFEYSNMNISGISYQALAQNGRLPDGYYTFCVEAVDYRSGKVISNTGCMSVYIIQVDPPLIQLPLCGSVVKVNNPQVINFAWQLFSGATAGIHSSIAYTLELFEITDPSVDPRYAILNNQALKIFESDPLSTLSFMYDVQAPPLEAGKRYAFRVTAKDVNGKDLFKNKGESQVCWFYYGYPKAAAVRLSAPPDFGAFAKSDRRILKWKGIGELLPQQQVRYHVRIIKADSGEIAAQAFNNTNTWFETTTTAANASGGEQELILPLLLDPMTDYAWQVTAISEEQEVSKSEIRTFRGPGAIEYFFAGTHRVQVATTYNDDLNSLSGMGRVTVTSDSQAIDVSFNMLRIGLLDKVHYLQAGEIQSAFKKPVRIQADAAIPKNGQASFIASALKLNDKELKLQGFIEWTMPHAVRSGLQAFRSKSEWFRYNNLKLLGESEAEKEVCYELIEPRGLNICIQKNSKFICGDSGYVLQLNGQVLLHPFPPESHRGGYSYPIAFHSQPQLLYIENLKVLTDTGLFFLPQSAAGIIPRSVTLDLSEEKSPLAKSADNRWKGIYFNTFDVRIPADGDSSNQLLLPAEHVASFESDQAGKTMLYTDRAGLTMKATKSYSSSGVICRFNEFNGRLKELNFALRDGRPENSYFKGEMSIPFVSAFEWYGFTIRAGETSMGRGDLDMPLAGKKILLGSEDLSNRCIATIRRSRFTENNSLVMAADVNFPSLGLSTVVDNLTLWGNGQAGFGKPDETAPLALHAEGLLENTIPLIADSLQFFFRPGNEGNEPKSKPVYGMRLSYEFSGEQVPGRVRSGIISTGEWENTPRREGAILLNRYRTAELAARSVVAATGVTELINAAGSGQDANKALLKKVREQNALSKTDADELNAAPKWIAFNDGVRLTWKPQDKKEVKGYLVYRGLSKKRKAAVLRLTANAVKTTEYFDALKPGTRSTFVYHVHCLNADGKKISTMKPVSVKLPDRIAPSKPVLRHLEEGTDETILCAAKNTETDVASYQVYRSENKKSFKPVAINPKTEQNSLLFYDRTAKKGGNYAYSMEAIDSAGNISGKSDAVALTRVNEDPPFAAPSKFRATFEKEKLMVQLSWTMKGRDYEGFVVYRKKPGGIFVAQTGLTGEFRHADHTIEKGKTYFYEVRAYNVSGKVTRSEIIEVRTNE